MLIIINNYYWKVKGLHPVLWTATSPHINFVTCENWDGNSDYKYNVVLTVLLKKFDVTMVMMMTFLTRIFILNWCMYLTQAMMDCLVSPPQPGDESYDTFIKVSVRVQLWIFNVLRISFIFCDHILFTEHLVAYRWSQK